MKQTYSNFVTPAGLVVLAALALVAAYFGNRPLLALLSGLFLLCLAARLWAKFSLDRLELTFDSDDCRGFPGDALEFGVSLRNRKLLPVIWLDVRLPLGEDACVAPEENEASFLWVMPWQSLRWRERPRALRRGVCALDSVTLASGDGFGLSDMSRPYPLGTPFRLIVYPALTPVDVSRILHSLSEPEPGKDGLYTDPTLLRGVRDYRDGDSFRDINWRLLARQGKMQVNVREKLDVRRACFVLDLESFSWREELEGANGTYEVRRVYAEALERMLSLAGSCAEALSPRGVICTLALPSIAAREETPDLPAAPERPARLVIPERRETQTEELLTALAEIDYRGEPTRFPVWQIAAEYHSLGQVFFFTKSPTGRERELERALDGSVRLVTQEGAPSGRVISETELMR